MGDFESKRPEYYRAYGKARKQRLRAAAIAAYGGKCACCGESNPKFLTLDHMDGGGRQHRKELKNRCMWSWVAQQGYPDNFQILCWNCNCASALNDGICPHKE